jgi:glycosyltransferase involved in cell wall biosynthesis
MVPKVSVIIPAKNEEVNIGLCLNAVKYQTLKPTDLIVVDNGSEDETVQIAKAHGATVLKLPNANIGELRNFGASFGKGDIYAFLDADCVPDRDWLRIAVEKLKDNQIGAVGNTVLPSGDENWVENVWYANIKPSEGLVRYIGSANLIVKREIFNKLKGFNPKLKAGEDRDFAWKIQKAGFKTVHDNRIRVTHLGYPKNISSFFKRELWHGKSIISDFSNLYKTRMLYLLILFNFFLFLSMLSLFLSPKSLLISSFCVLLLPITISFIKCFQNKNCGNLIQLALLYLVYLSARTISMYSSIFGYFFCKILHDHHSSIHE